MATAYKSVLMNARVSGSKVVVTCDPAFAGKTISCSKDGTTFTQVCPSTSPYTVTFEGLDVGVWTISGTVEGDTFTTTAEVQDVSCVLSYGFVWTTWVDTSNELDSTDYSTLDDLLEDEEAIRELMLEHACVDYLTQFTSVTPNLEKVINNDLCAKWVNECDYALDNMIANAAIKAAMDVSDVKIVNKVPKMTSYNTPSGIAGTDSPLTGYDAYKAFDRDSSTRWNNNTQSLPSKLYYKFTEPTCIKGFVLTPYYADALMVREYEILASNDGETWSEPLFTETLTNVAQTVTRLFENDENYLYYAINVKSTYYSGGKSSSITELQFLGEEPCSKYELGEWALMPQVPKMTSNTAPYGTAFASTAESSYPAYKAFDNDDSSYWSSEGVTNQYVGYSFTSPIKLGQVKIIALYSSVVRLKNFKIQGSNDGFVNDVHDLYTGVYPNTQDYELNVVINADEEYTDFRLYAIDNYGSANYIVIKTLQFYAWAPKGNVPVMTSNTVPYGEASATSSSTNYDPYKAFIQTDVGENDRWVSLYSHTNDYIQYKFVNPVCVKRVAFKSRPYSRLIGGDTALATTATIQGSNDGFVNDTNNLATISITVEDADKVVDYDVSTNDDYYLYYRIQFNGPNVHYQQYDYCGLTLLQFYGRELSVSVPEMTSNITPYGTVSNSNGCGTARINGVSEGTSGQWVFFQRTYTDSASKRTIADCPPNEWIQYEFSHPVVIRGFTKKNNYDGAQWYVNKFEIVASNDGTNFESLGNFTNSAGAFYQTVWYFDNDTPYKYYRVINREDTEGGHSISNAIGSWANFFGVDYSEKEFEEGNTKKWLYDHGLELEEVQTYITGTSVVAKRVSDVYMKSVSGEQARIYFNFNVGSFSLLRAKMGKEIVNSTKNNVTFHNMLTVLASTSTSDYTQIATLNLLPTNDPNNHGLDISSVSSGYPFIYGAGNDMVTTLTEMWLE